MELGQKGKGLTFKLYHDVPERYKATEHMNEELIRMVKVRIEGLPEEVEKFTEQLEKDEKYEFLQKEIEIIKDGLSYNEELECIAKRFGMTQEQALKTIVEEVYNSEASSLGFSLKDALDLIHNCDCRFSECDPSQDVPF